MKALLTVSLIVNLALAGTVVWFLQRNPHRVHDKPLTESAANPAQPGPTDTVQRVSESAVGSQPGSKSFGWEMVESEDYKKYIANLRAIGCPEETIRDIITADVNKLFEARRREMAASTNKFQFWKTGNPFADMMNPARLEQAQALAKEKRELLTELLGSAPVEKADLFAGINPFESMLDFLSPAKQNQVMEIMTKYQAKIAGKFSGGAPDAEDRLEMKKLQQEMETELAGMMSPQEYDDYQLRMSQTAMMMRMQLSSFEPSEQEFREIFKIKKPFDDEFTTMGMPGGQRREERDKMNAARKEMEDKLKNLLGAERYAEYERAHDHNYQQIYRVTSKQGLPKDTAVKVLDMKKAAEEQARKLRQDQSLSAEQRTATLKAIRQETERSMQETLGARGWESYQSEAYWLRSISPDE